MNDLISREGLIKEVCGKCDGACDCCCEENCIRCKRPNMRCDFRKDLDDAPTVDAVPVVHGRWIKHIEIGAMNNHCECSVCNWETPLMSTKRNYCPNCGAKMDGGENDGSE